MFLTPTQQLDNALRRVFEDAFIGVLGLSVIFFIAIASSQLNLQSEVSAGAEAVTQLTANVSNLKSEVKQTSTQLSDIRKEREKLQKELADIKTAREQLDEQLKSTSAQAQSTEKTLQTQVKEKGEQVKVLGDTIAGLKKDVESKINDLAVLEEELTTTKKNLQDQQDLTTTLQNQNDVIATKAALLQTQRAQFLQALESQYFDEAQARVVENNFVVQSALLFAPDGMVSPQGQIILRQIMTQYQQIVSDITPPEKFILMATVHTADPVVMDTLNAPPTALETTRQRAGVLNKTLVSMGIDPNDVGVVAAGATRPFDTRVDEFARRRNQRVDFTLVQVN